MQLNKRTAEQLRRDYPDHVPLDVAAKYLGVSHRQFSWLIAEGREPYASTGGNIGKKQLDGGVSILAKGRTLFPETEPLISTGGGAAERRRVMEVSRMAALMERNGVLVVGEPIDTDQPHFIPSACWRKIVPGILSTTRFAGMLITEEERIAVYDIGDGRMEWQGRAEGSLFHPRYGTYEVRATGMLLIYQDGVRNRAVEQIICYTMWQRRQLLRDRRPSQRERPVRWSRAPIRLRKLYGRVYLSTPARFRQDLDRILSLPVVSGLFKLGGIEHLCIST